MVSIEQILNGALIFARDYLIGQIPKDNFKFLAGNVALEILGVSVNNHKAEIVQKVKDMLSSSPWASMIDVITPDGMVDIEVIRQIAPKYIQPEGFKLEIPKIGVFTILPNDVDVIYNCIVNCPTVPLGINGGVN